MEGGRDRDRVQAVRPGQQHQTWSANPHEFDIFQTSYAWLAYDPSSTYQEFATGVAGNYSNYSNPQYDT